MLGLGLRFEIELRLWVEVRAGFMVTVIPRIRVMGNLLLL